MDVGDEDEDDLSHNDFVSHNFDLNDNAHIVSRMDQYQTIKPLEDQSKAKILSTKGSPHHCAIHSSITSDNSQQAGPILYSPEDTLNNDFFYDDEFAVQFDATLGGNEEEILDSMEFSSLLHGKGDDNQRWRNLARMSSSKSDSCLYQAELDLSCPSDAIGSSTERELLSSSDLSDFKAEPLFSPPPPEGDMEDSGSGFPHDSLCNEELAGSLVKDEDRFAFNWVAAKDQYMISFDRSPTKYSTDESYHEPPPKKPNKQLTCWGQRSGGNTSSGSGAYSTASSGSRRSSSHLSSTGCSSSGASGSDNSLPTCPSLISHEHVIDSGKQSSTDTSTSSTMTTWKLVKHQCKNLKDSVPEGMTTWKKVKESCMTGSKTTRSQSMPDLQPAPVKEESALTSESKCEHLSEDFPKKNPKRYSASLLETYQRMKSCPGEITSYEEPDFVDPSPMLQFEMDTWSISPASSHQFSPTAECEKGILDNSLVKWQTRKNLVGSAGTKFDMAVQAGSVLEENSKRMKGNVSIQFPPTLNHCAIQTSMEGSTKSKKKKVPTATLR